MLLSLRGFHPSTFFSINNTIRFCREFLTFRHAQGAFFITQTRGANLTHNFYRIAIQKLWSNNMEGLIRHFFANFKSTKLVRYASFIWNSWREHKLSRVFSQGYIFTNNSFTTYVLLILLLRKYFKLYEKRTALNI